MPITNTRANFCTTLTILIANKINHVMVRFQFTKIVDVDRDLIFAISTDYENFTKVLPKYFKSLEIIDSKTNKTIIKEKVNFLERTATILTEHIVIKPNRHIVTMLDGQAKDTCFDETYEKNGSRTKITIKVNLILHGSLKIIGFFAKKRIQIHMEKVMDEFVNYSKNNSA